MTPPCWTWRGRSCAGGSPTASELADFPGVVAREQGGEVTGAAPAAGGVDLLRHQLVVTRLLHLAEDPDRGMPEVGRVQPGQRERVGRVGTVRVVGNQRVRIGLLDLSRLELAVPAEAQALRAAREPDRLAVLELDQPLVGRAGLLERGERVVVEDGAVLVDLDERGAL